MLAGAWLPTVTLYTIIAGKRRTISLIESLTQAPEVRLVTGMSSAALVCVCVMLVSHRIASVQNSEIEKPVSEEN